MEFSHVSFALIAFSVFVVVYLILRKNSEKQINIKLEGRACPCCGSTEFALGKQIGLASIYSLKAPLTKGSHVIHVICLSCGHIDESYVEKPKNFK